LTVQLNKKNKNFSLQVRVKTKELLELIQDDERLREERKKAKKNKNKYVGIDSDSSHGRRSYNDYSSSSSSMSTTKSTPAGFADLDSKEWRTNNSTIQEKINNITSTVKNIIDTSLDDGDNNNNGSEEENEEEDQVERQKPTANKPVAEFKLSKPVESSNKSKLNEKAANKSPIKLKTNLASKEASKSEEVDEFGDFVSHRVDSAPSGAATTTNSDFLLSFDNLK